MNNNDAVCTAAVNWLVWLLTVSGVLRVLTSRRLVVCVSPALEVADMADGKSMVTLPWTI